MEFEYTVKEGRVTLKRCYGDEERILIPEEIDGCPVTYLDAYVFSQSRREKDLAKAICGNQVKELILPSTLLGIGNYAFYGCFSLEKLTFRHRIRSIGGGVFTGCHRLSYLAVDMEDAFGYSLKNILGELHHELKIEFRYGKDNVSILLFPEFYEEAVENTPARNVDMQFHGSGYSYRQCFRDGVIQYPEYDRAFTSATFLESEDFCIELCMLRLTCPRELTDTAKGTYMSWLMEHRMSAGTWCIEFEQNEYLEFLSSFVDWREEELEDLIRMANEHKKMEALSFLMDYKNRHYAKRRKKFEF